MAINKTLDAAEVEVPLDDEDSGPRSTRIKPGSPLSIRISSVFPGDNQHKNGRTAILTSAVRSPMLQDAKPLAMHYLYDDVRYGSLMNSRADQPGSDVIYYSPAELSEQLDVTVRLAFDRFNKATFDSWVDAAATAASLPVFAVSGPAGAAWVAVAKKATKFVTRVIDGAIDNDNDRIMTWRVNLSAPGRPLTKSGYVLLYPDGNELMPAHAEGTDDAIVSSDGAFEKNGEQFIVRNGKLYWRDDREKAVLSGDAYVLAYINGAKIRELESWSAAAVAANLTEKFLNANRIGDDDALEAFKLFNDVRWLKEINAIDKEAKSLEKSPNSAEKTKQLKDLSVRREAAQKNIQDDAVRDLYAESENSKIAK